MVRGGMPESALLLTLLAAAIAAAATARVAGSAGSVCATANCGKGSCSEAPGLIPFATSYNCTCDPGWSQAIQILPFSPCAVPKCSFDPACFNTSLTPPKGIPITDPCVAISCGRGECKKGNGLGAYSCECQPGFTNLLNDTSLPCIGRNCTFGADCAKLGLTNPPGSHGPSPAPAPIESGRQY